MRRRSSANLGQRFEKFVSRLFESYDFQTEVYHANTKADLRLTSPSESKALVEVKLYTSLQASPANLIRAKEQLTSALSETGIAIGILATNSRVSSEVRSRITDPYDILIYDFDVLSELAKQDPSLLEEFSSITREALMFRGGDLPEASQVDVDPLLNFLRKPPEESRTSFHREPTTIQNEGADLCGTLNAVGRGQKNAKPFEAACSAAIRFLFKEELVDFDDQYGSHEGMHRFDLIARVASKGDFWEALVNDFRARYIIFEFKNYSKKIGQPQIYTTEKYLYPVATRGAAILVSKHGADSGADRAMRGALRESGKLILSLSVKEICEMLHFKDAGGDHISVLAEKLNDMLMGLER